MPIINFDGQLDDNGVAEDVQTRVLAPLGSRALFPEQGTEIYQMAEGVLALTTSQIQAMIESALRRSSLYALENVSVTFLGDVLGIEVTVILPDGTERTMTMTTPTDLRRILLDFIDAFGLQGEVQETTEAITVTLYESIDPAVDPDFGRRQVTSFVVPKANDGVVNGFTRGDAAGQPDPDGPNLILHRTVGGDILIPDVFTTSPVGQALTSVALPEGTNMLVFQQSGGRPEIAIALPFGLNADQVDQRIARAGVAADDIVSFGDASFDSATMTLTIPTVQRDGTAGDPIVADLSATPPPAPTTYLIEAGWATTADGVLNPKSSINIPAERAASVTFPSNPIAGRFAILEAPAGFHFTSIRAIDFPNLETLNGWTESADRRRRYRPNIKQGVNYTLLVTIEGN